VDALFNTAQIRAIETAAAAGLPGGTLMQRAGRAATEAALGIAGPPAGAAVLVLAGPGNNGGDGLEVAANLAELGAEVTVVHLGSAEDRSPEAHHALMRAQAAGAVLTAALPPGRFALVVDAMFGIGLARPLAGRAAELAAYASAANCPVLALDVPSGLDAETGAVVGPAGTAVMATHTVTFIGDKPGLHTGDGKAHAGEVIVAALGIAPDMFPEPAARINAPALFPGHLRPRGVNSHKGSFGNVAVVGGARGMSGAPLLAARAALLGGAGRVFAVFLDDGPALDPGQPELMCRAAAGFDYGSATIVAGPGLGTSPDAVHVLLRAFDSASPLVLDADALNLLATSPDLQERLAARGNAVLTPHPLEAARMLGMTSAIVQADRMAAAHELAKRFNAAVILKGAGSVIAHGDAIVINPTGNPGLATAGSGDVLAGLCGSLLAQGWPVHEAALGATWIHGQAADELVAHGAGPIGLTAGELPVAARRVLNGLVGRSGQRRS
jgi:hydroxyethylthiazole kinase-like uncharacterized protein yjeF